nr:hypothetical protein [Tanacetum cinerariifolium]
LLTHALGVEIVNIVVNDCMNVNCLNMDTCEHCVTTESELKTNFIKKENYEMFLKQYHSLEKHCISLEVNNQLNTEIFQRDTVSSLESAPTFAELFETNELKAQIQEKDTVILKLKEKIKSSNGDDKERKVESKVEEIDTQNLELDHQSVEVADLNASLQEKVLVITALKEQLKGKAVLPKAVSLNPIDPSLLQVDVVPLVPKLHKNRTAHINYIKHTLEEAATLRELVESERLLSPLNTPLAYALAVTPKNQTKQVKRVALFSSASGSQSKDNTKKNRIWRTHKKAKETELEDHPRKVKSSLNKANVVDSRANSSIIKSVSNVNSNLKCASCNGCLFSDNHDA